MELIERIEEFTNKVYNLYGKNPMTQNFIEYWTEHNDGAKKCRFEFEKVFNIGRRINTWKRNEIRFGTKKPDFKETIIDLSNGAEDIFKEWDNKRIG